MITESAIKLIKRWISEKQDIIDMHEEKIVVLRKDIASFEERIDILNSENTKEVKANE